MADERNVEIVDEPRKYTASQDFEGGLSKSGTDVATTTDVLGLEIVASGDVQLSSGSATVDTGVSESETATFHPALGPETNDADVAAEVRSDSGTGTYVVDIVETQDSSVGNPTVAYDIIRVR